LVITFIAPGETDDDYIGWQFSVRGEVVKCWHQFAMGEIPGSAKDYDVAGLRHGTCG
jgi:hypothetical protein